MENTINNIYNILNNNQIKEEKIIDYADDKGWLNNPKNPFIKAELEIMQKKEEKNNKTGDISDNNSNDDNSISEQSSINFIKTNNKEKKKEHIEREIHYIIIINILYIHLILKLIFFMYVI